MHQNFHEEAIELGFGKRIGAFHLDGILRGHDQKGRFQFVRGSAAGDGAFLHGFEQRRLGFGRGAIDLVGQHQVGEDRPRLKSQGFRAAIVGFDDHAADDVGGHEIGRELNARILEMQYAASVRSSVVLPRPGTPSSKTWPPARRQMRTPSTTSLLADDDLADFAAHQIEVAGGELESGVRHLYILAVELSAWLRVGFPGKLLRLRKAQVRIDVGFGAPALRPGRAGTTAQNPPSVFMIDSGVSLQAPIFARLWRARRCGGKHAN